MLRIIDANVFIRLAAQENVRVIDCRTYDEYVNDHYKYAMHLGNNGLSEKIKKLSKNTKLIFICDRGATSLMVAKDAAALGFEAYSVAGGYQEILLRKRM